MKTIPCVVTVKMDRCYDCKRDRMNEIDCMNLDSEDHCLNWSPQRCLVTDDDIEVG